MNKVIPAIKVNISDSSNAPLQGVTVVLNGVSKTTGSAGGCNFLNIEEGNYTITASLDGYKDYSETIEVTLSSYKVNIVLEED